MHDPSHFRWKLFDYRHRLGFDLRSNECIGLIREIRLCRNLDESDVEHPYISVITLEGMFDFLPEEVGHLDIDPGIVITKEELIESLDFCRNRVRYIADCWGTETLGFLEAERDYRSLVRDVKEIMCANHFFTLHDYQFIQTQSLLKEMGG